MSGAPVTVLITRRVRPGRHAEFERLLNGLHDAAARATGHLGGHLIPPELGGASWQVLLAFDSPENLQAWNGSDERARWLSRMEAVTYGETSMRVLNGLEAWFTVPAAPMRRLPSRPRMAFVTWLGLYPLVLLVSHLLRPLMVGVPTALVVLAVTGTVVTLMTWVVMPALNRLLAGWLFPVSPLTL